MTAEKRFLWSGVSLAGLLLGFLGNSVWGKVEDHEKRITRNDERLEAVRDMRDDLRAMRADMTEVRDAVRRLEGERDVSRRP